ncbi:hypothetical protein CMI48_01460 [Candidatus Pacearchaeota archaeon]|jgi:hypothetical protein|nr:hypothetical protein [Candidatus Pacearchaeota archaeon]
MSERPVIRYFEQPSPDGVNRCISVGTYDGNGSSSWSLHYAADKDSAVVIEGVARTVFEELKRSPGARVFGFPNRRNAEVGWKPLPWEERLGVSVALARVG